MNNYKSIIIPANNLIHPYKVMEYIVSVLQNCKEEDFNLITNFCNKNGQTVYKTLATEILDRGYFYSPDSIIKKFNKLLTPKEKFTTIRECYELLVNIFENYIPSSVNTCLYNYGIYGHFDLDTDCTILNLWLPEEVDDDTQRKLAFSIYKTANLSKGDVWCDLNCIKIRMK